MNHAASTSNISTTSSCTSASSYKSLDRSKLLGATAFGKFRDLIEIHILTVNGEPLKTNITHQMAYTYICKRSLRLKQSEIHGMQMTWKGHPVVEIRLTDTIDIDSFPPNFEFTIDERSGSKYYCEISGVRAGERASKEEENPDDPWTRWVSVEGTGYAQKEDIVSDWLLRYGEFLTDYDEEAFEVVDDDPDIGEEATPNFGSGKFKVKMRIVEHIPQYLPVNGKKVKIYYKGIEKLCTNCYHPGHMKAECKNRKITWLQYVEKFMEDNIDVPARLYGRWINVVRAAKMNLTQDSTTTLIPERNLSRTETNPAPPTRASLRIQSQPGAQRK